MGGNIRTPTGGPEPAVGHSLKIVTHGCRIIKSHKEKRKLTQALRAKKSCTDTLDEAHK